jgi:hypothetical protein
MKPKAALVKAGILPAGSENKRGRLSLDMIEKVKELAIANPSWNIEGYEVSKPTAATDKPEVVKVKNNGTGILDVPDEAKSESLWEAFVNDNGKTIPVGMRTVDNVCGNSLTYCRCASPKIWLDHAREGVVYFKARTPKS